MVKEINGLAEFEREIRDPGLVVVDFFYNLVWTM